MAGQVDEKYRVLPFTTCLLCGKPFNIVDSLFEDFFACSEIRCPKCKEPIDWWKRALSIFSNDLNFLVSGYYLVQAESIFFQVLLRPNESTDYKLTEFGIPRDAKILSVGYTPINATLFPVEQHGNESTEKRSRHEVSLWPVPIAGKATLSDTKVNVLVTWVPHSDLDDAWKNIVAALEAFKNSEFLASIIPANVAIESTLSITLNQFLSKYVGKERTKNFLRDGATYSHQLNVVLPLLVKLLSLPDLPDSIRGSLNKLRRFRNDMSHLGTIDEPISKELCAELLCAALFGFRYVLLLQKKLAPIT